MQAKSCAEEAGGGFLWEVEGRKRQQIRPNIMHRGAVQDAEGSFLLHPVHYVRV